MTTENEAPQPEEAVEAEAPKEEGTATVEDATKGLRSELTKERRKAKEAQKQLEALLAEKAAAEEAEKTELEKAQEAAAKLQAELEAERSARALEAKRSAVQAEAAKLGFNDPADVASFLNLNELDSEDLAEAVKDLSQTKPYLIKADPAPQAVGADSSQTSSASTADPDSVLGRGLAQIIGERTKGKSFSFGND